MAATRWLALVAVLTLTTMALAGPEWVEQGDAGDSPGGAQDTTGVGPVGRIVGKLDALAGASVAGGADFQDVFKIFIDNPTLFQITTEYGIGDTEFEARIFLFTIDGEGLLGAVMGEDGLAAVLNASNDGTSILITEPGLYLLAITVSPFGPQCEDGTVFTFTFDGEISGPDGTAPEDCIWIDWTTQPVEYGACCFGGEPCMLINADDCETLDGEYLGDGSSCLDCPAAGACCFGDVCEILTEDDCGGKGSYLGDGTTCDPNPCIPMGVCCLFDGTCQELVEELDCIDAGGLYQGDGTTCASTNGCTSGACEVYGPTAGSGGTICVDGLSELECVESFYGIYLGNGTACDIGACCKADGTCVVTTVLDCESGIGGVYQGPATDCGTLVGGTCFGACDTKGFCFVTTEYDCEELGGTYLGNGTLCTGACCLFDGMCTVTTEDDCLGQGGVYQNDFTTCPPSGGSCIGACIIDDSPGCVDVSEAECSSLGGDYLGNGSGCTASAGQGGIAGTGGLPTIGVNYKLSLQGVTFSNAPPGIPTLSEWALIIMGMLLLGAITILIRRV